MLVLEKINKQFTEIGPPVLEEISFEVATGEFVSLLGPSGCGKTTLLKIIDGLVLCDEGTISLNGQILQGITSQMAFVFQEINLLPWKCVWENVALGLVGKGVPRVEQRRIADEYLKLVNMAHTAEQPIYTLSGGMQQRVGVARALAMQPEVLLMDEPFGQLDNFTRTTLQIELSKLLSKLQMSVVFVTHDVDEAIFLSDKIVVFSANPGRIQEICTVNLPRPRWKYNVRANPDAIRLREHIVTDLLGLQEGEFL